MICALLGSLAMPIFFLAVRHFQMESETAEWMVSMWPRSLGEVALEDRRAAADMVVTYGVLVAASMLTYTVVGWTALIILERSESSPLPHVGEAPSTLRPRTAGEGPNFPKFRRSECAAQQTTAPHRCPPP